MKVDSLNPIQRLALLLSMVSIMVSMVAMADDANLRVSIAGGAFNSKFKFFDASEGCPSYNDIPGAKHHLGGVRASSKGTSKTLRLGEPVHVFLFRPKDTPGISARGGPSEIRRRSLQVVLSGDATLRYTGFDDKVPTWEATGEIDVQPAAACETGEDPDADEGPETADVPETDEDASSNDPEA